MMTFKTKFVVAAVVTVGILASCKKDKDNKPSCTTSMASLAGTYKLTSAKYKANASSPEVDYLATMDDCEKDDLITLNADGSYNYQDAGVVCAPNGNETGNWSLSGNTITSDGVVDGTISSFDCKTLVYYLTDLGVPGDKLTFTIVKQ